MVVSQMLLKSRKTRPRHRNHGGHLVIFKANVAFLVVLEKIVEVVELLATACEVAAEGGLETNRGWCDSDVGFCGGAES